MFHQKFNPDNIFFVSDIHGQHSNLCKGVSQWDNTDRCRDFNSIEEMNESIIKSINDTVPWDSFLFHIGDFLFGDKSKVFDFRNRINCQNIIHIHGNHDDFIRKLDPSDIEKLFIWTGDYLEISVGKKLIILCHYPFAVWRECHKGSWCITGHSHGTYRPSTKECLTEGKILDVGWDCFNKPVSFKEVKEIMDRKFVANKDHHNKETT